MTIDKQIKLLLIVTGMPDVNGNGGSQFNQAYLSALIGRNIRVTVIHLRSISLKRKLYDEKVIDGVKRITISCYIPPIKYLFGVRFLSFVFRIISKGKVFDYNLVHGVGGGAAIASSIMSRRAKVPFIIQFIGGDVNHNLISDLRDLRNFESIKNANLMTFNSKKLESDFFAKVKIMRQSKVIYRGVDTAEFSYNYPDSRDLRILFLGGVLNHDEKGAFTMAEFCNKILLKPIFKNPITVKLGGPKIEKIRAAIDGVLNDNIDIQVLGALGRDRVKQEMKESNIVIIPSISEGMPNVLFESMAAGNIVIATRVGGIPEIIVDGINGFFINSQSSEEIIQVLKYLESNSDNSSIAMAARKTVEQYSYDDFVTAYINEYYELLA